MHADATTQVETKKISITLPLEVAQALGVAAAMTDQSKSELATTLLTEGLSAMGDLGFEPLPEGCEYHPAIALILGNSKN